MMSARLLRKLYSTSAPSGGETLVNSFKRLRGTVFDVIARSFPEEHRGQLAERWGFIKAPQAARVPLPTPSAAAAPSARSSSAAPVLTELPTPPPPSVAPPPPPSTETPAHVDQPPAETRKPPISTETPQPPITAATPQLPISEPPAPVPSQPAPAPHPVFGLFLHDLGYKRLYCSSIDKLVHVPIWRKQRTLRPERASIIADVLRSGKRLPGVITLVELADSTVAIVDGQHRVGALMLLAESGSWAASDNTVPIDVFPAGSEKDISVLFTEINKAEPVKLIDLPVEEGGASESVRDVLNTATSALRDRFPAMFKPSQSCRPPHLNIDALRDELFQNDVVSRKGFTTSDELLGWFISTNETLAALPAAHWEGVNASKVFGKAVEKAREHGFFLGLDNAWLNQP
eukprot:jgi/Mesvir1/21724/Mv04136-RA.1